MLEVKKINKTFGSTQALASLSLTLAPGLYVLTGPNGAGKTTFLRAISGASLPDSGEILLNGIDIINQRETARRHISYLSDQNPIYSDMTVEGHLVYRARLKGLSSKRLRARIRHVSELFNLKPIFTKRNSDLTAGQRKCVCLADAMLTDTPLLAIDEPFHGLDIFHSDLLLKALSSLSHNSVNIIATHRLDIAERLDATCLVMARGFLADTFQVRQPDNTIPLSERVKNSLKRYYNGSTRKRK